MKTPYEVLGVHRRADGETIRAALRRAAKRYHPDLHVEDPAAEQRLKEFTAAYDTLKHPHKRAAYDRDLRRRGRQSAGRFWRTAFASAGLVSSVALVLIVWLSKPPQPAAPATETSVAAEQKPEPERTAVPEPDRIPQPVWVADVEREPSPAAPKAQTPLAGEWDQLAGKGDPLAVWAFVVRNPENPEAGMARSWLMRLLDATEDATLLKTLRADAGGALAERAQRRLDQLGHPGEAVITKQATAPVKASDGEPRDMAHSKDPAFYLERGLRRLQAADLDRAITDFGEAIRLEPGNAAAYCHRANAWGRKGEKDRALADFETAIKIDPANATALRGRGSLLRLSGALDRALVDLDQAIRLGFSDATAYNERGQVWLEKGNYERAIADFNQALKIDPNLAGAYFNRARALSGKGDLDRASADFNQAVSLDPRMTAAHRLVVQDGERDGAAKSRAD